MNFDVIIVGGGLVGASLAAALKHSGLSLALVESQPAPVLSPAWDSRIYAISPGSRDFLEQCGAWALLDAERIAPDPPKLRVAVPPEDSKEPAAPAAAAEPELPDPPLLDPPPSVGKAATEAWSIPARFNPFRPRPDRLPRICGAIRETNFSAAVEPASRIVF